MGLRGSPERARRDIVRLAHSGLDSTSFQREAAAKLRSVVPADAYGFRAAFVSANRCWGFICLHRERSWPDFSPQEADFLAGLVVHLGEGLRKSLLISAPAAGGLDELSPGLLELTDALEVATMNDAAERWLEDLGLEGSATGGRLPEAIHAVVAQLRALEVDPALALLPRLRVRSRSGRWLVVHASRLRGDPWRTAVIIEPATRVEIAPLVAQAYGLSDRERQVCQLVMQGLSTSEIADGLHISRNTVQDHLKAIFDKVGVRSRSELVGQVFLEHYWPLQGSRLGPHGRFASWE